MVLRVEWPVVDDVAEDLSDILLGAGAVPVYSAARPEPDHDRDLLRACECVLFLRQGVSEWILSS